MKVLSERVAVLAYPELQDSDRRWIEDVRRVEDPEFDAVRPHFTLAFPAPIPGAEAVAHASSVALGASPFRFELDAVVVVPNRFGAGFHVFLVPTTGSAEIEALHTALAAGPFGPHRIAGVPFVPHMTVAAHRREQDCQDLIATWGGKIPRIRGWIHELDVVEVWPERTPSIRRIPLGMSAA